MGILLDQIKELKKINDKPYDFFSVQFSNPDKKVVELVYNHQIQVGFFYFLFYDLAGNLKSSKMEQYSPILVLKKAVYQGKYVIWGLCLNFIPDGISIEWFDRLINRFYKNLFNTEQEIEQVNYLKSLDVTYEGIYRSLAHVGFEYAIREYRLDLVDRAYHIHYNQLARLLMMDKEQITNVDTKKLVEIWLAKLGSGEERLRKLKDEIILEKKIITSELENSFKYIKEL